MHGNLAFTKAVGAILSWAQIHNEESNKHFPIMGVGYGFLSMIRSQMWYAEKYLLPFEGRGKLQLNLAHDPEHTFLFDEYKKEEIEKSLDKIKFLCDLSVGITLTDFVLHEHHMSQLFIPIGTYHDSNLTSSNEEFVAAVEGVVYPWFGIGYRIDRIQFSFE